MENKTLSKAAAMAQFRLAVIAPVIHGLYPDASRNAYYERITGNPFTLPDGSVVRYSPGTISKWVAQYQNGGIEALMPRERADKGGTRVLPDTAIEEIHRLKQAFPRLNATQIYRQLVEEGFIPATVSVCAVQRYIKHNDLKSARNPNLRDRKAFEEDSFGKLWQADTCYLPHITENGRRRRVYCIMIIDDHSRLLVGGGLFYNDTSYNFQKVLKAAVAVALKGGSVNTGMEGGVVRAHIVQEQGVELFQGSDIIQLQGVEPTLLKGTEVALHLGLTGSIPHLGVEQDCTQRAADEGELLIGVGGAVVHIELHGDAVGGDSHLPYRY